MIDEKVAMKSPLIGGTYTPSQGDYKNAAYGNFTYQIVTQDLSDQDAILLYSYLSDSTIFQTIIAQTYGDLNVSTTNVTAGSTPINHIADPIEVSAAYSNSMQKQYFILFNILILVSTILYLY